MATINPGGDYGKKELSPALRNRFTEIWVPSMPDPEDSFPGFFSADARFQNSRALLHSKCFPESPNTRPKHTPEAKAHFRRHKQARSQKPSQQERNYHKSMPSSMSRFQQQDGWGSIMLKADLKPSPWRKTAEKVCRSLRPEVAST